MQDKDSVKEPQTKGTTKGANQSTIAGRKRPDTPVPATSIVLPRQVGVITRPVEDVSRPVRLAKRMRFFDRVTESLEEAAASPIQWLRRQCGKYVSRQLDMGTLIQMNQAFEAIKNHAGVSDDVAKWTNLAATHLGVKATAIPDAVHKTLLGVVTAGDEPEDSPAKRLRESSRPMQVGESLREKLKDAGVEYKTETVSFEFKDEPAQRDSCLLFEGNRVWVIGTQDDGVSPKEASLCIKSVKIKVQDGVVSMKHVDCSKQVPSILRSGIDTNAVILDHAYMLIGTTLPSGSRETYLWNMYSEDASRRWILPNITAEPGCFTPSFLAQDDNSVRCLLFTKSGRIKEITRFRKGRFQLSDITPPEGPLFVTAVNQTNSTNWSETKWGFLCACRADDGTQFMTTVVYSVEKGVSLLKTPQFPSPKTTTALCTWGSTTVFADQNGRVDAVFGDTGRRATLIKAEPEWASVTSLVVILQPWLLFANRFITVRFHKNTISLYNTVCKW